MTSSTANSTTLLNIAWFTLGSGRICLGKKPDNDYLVKLKQSGVSHLATVQTGEEEGRSYESKALEAGLTWVWLPFDRQKAATQNEEAYIQQYLTELKALLADGASVYLHCDGTQQRCSLLLFALCVNKGMSTSSAYAVLHSFGKNAANQLPRSALEWAAAIGRK
ncbi:hypothetical protein [Alteromonas sp. KUL49]|uniref:hypothetical protein n=1 Tax=Alteromonas sp. KUL49 TaxID=2480798 RepID=UPI00102EFDAE|nr:hypothetical protein [Alteromonas sp. KUL49]TAP38835.1 hypothetical protein EYS00_13110 [Alteromonas sp. KUL49]GEA12266.1 hypothetical protein KUL49_26410 [Alteromonas sp. KUL49]